MHHLRLIIDMALWRLLPLVNILNKLNRSNASSKTLTRLVLSTWDFPYYHLRFLSKYLGIIFRHWEISSTNTDKKATLRVRPS